MKPLRIIILSVLIVTGGSVACLLSTRFLNHFFSKNSRYAILRVVQHSPTLASLPTDFFAEKLSLSTETPQNLYEFNLEEGRCTLMRTQIFQELHLEKIKPETLLVKYVLREPIASLGNLGNTLLDQEGHLFPNFPYYRPKKIPEIFFTPQKEFSWGRRVDPQELQVAVQLLGELQGRRVLRIDLSRLKAQSLGAREVLVTVKRGEATDLIRLPPKKTVSQLKNYFALLPELAKGDKKGATVDLRIDDVAFIGAL